MDRGFFETRIQTEPGLGTYQNYSVAYAKGRLLEGRYIVRVVLQTTLSVVLVVIH